MSDVCVTFKAGGKKSAAHVTKDSIFFNGVEFSQTRKEKNPCE